MYIEKNELSTRVSEKEKSKMEISREKVFYLSSQRKFCLRTCLECKKTMKPKNWKMYCL